MSAPAWVSTIEGSRNASGPGLVALCQLLATDEETPPALRELSRRFVSSNLYRADRPRVRENDPETSQAAARRVRGRARAGGSVHRLLRAYRAAEDHGLTSRAAEKWTGIRAAHKRTSELLADGLLRVVMLDGEELVRGGGRVLTITDDGREELARLDAIGSSRA